MAKKEALFFCLLISIYLYFFMVTKSYYDEGLKLPTTTTTEHQQKQAIELANTKAGPQQGPAGEDVGLAAASDSILQGPPPALSKG